MTYHSPASGKYQGGPERKGDCAQMAKRHNNSWHWSPIEQAKFSQGCLSLSWSHRRESVLWLFTLFILYLKAVQLWGHFDALQLGEPPFVQKESVSLQESYRHKIIFENNKGAGIRVCSKIVGVFRWIYRLDRQRSGAAHYSDKTNKWWVMGFHPCWVWGHWKI